MKKIILLFILILNFNLTVKADDISDFEIEGISVGDSLLDHMSEEEIKNNTVAYFKDKRKYFIVSKTNDLNSYDILELYIKTGDEKYVIRTIGAFLDFQGKECLSKKKEIDKEFKIIFSNLKSYSGTLNHQYDKSGKSKQIQTNYVFGDSAHKDDHIRTECINWSQEMKQREGFSDSLIVIAMTSEILKWIGSGYE